MTKEEITICKMYLNDLDRTHGCNEYKLLMQLLEQQPCEDAVSRQAVKDGMIKYGFHSSDMTITEFVEDVLPPVIPKGVTVTDFADKCRECGKQKNGKWIPVSEKLPEEYIEVIGTTDFGDIYKTELYDDCGKKKWYANGRYDEPIVAWMPLPKPYKEEKE